jgi:O-acetyl-ADP-ribose deacetylase (regulator of RNase III)
MNDETSEHRDYQFGNCTLTLEFGDITSSQADVIVSSDDYMLTMRGGVSAAIRRVGGEAVMIDAAKKTPANL